MIANVRSACLRAIAPVITAPTIAALSAAPLAVIAIPSHSHAQSAPTPAPTNTVCRYDLESGIPNPLGMRTYITLTEAEGNTTFTLDRFATFVTNPENTDQQADVTEVRSLTFYGTPIAEARQLMIDQPFYYAELLEVDEDSLDAGFEAVDQTLGCGQVAAEPTPAEPPAVESPVTEAPAPPTESPILLSLPNGNYRFVSADFDNRVVSDEELVEAGGAIFLFRKFGDAVTGELSYIDSDNPGFCISGTVEDNRVIGTVVSDSDRILGDFLVTKVAEDGALEGVLNLEDFSRINAGARLPTENCS